VLTVSKELPEILKGSELATTLVHSGSSPALNYAGAQAESPKEFLTKLKVCLNDLLSTHICLRIAKRLMGPETQIVDPAIEECGHLIALFAKSVKTKKSNMSAEKKEEAGAL